MVLCPPIARKAWEDNILSLESHPGAPLQAEADIRALETRNARLEKDLEAAVVKAEVLTAKGAMCVL